MGAYGVDAYLVFNGLPWLFAGYSMLGTPLQGYAPIIGTLGVSLVVVTMTVAAMLSVDQTQSSKIRLGMAGEFWRLRAWESVLMLRFGPR